MTEEQKAIETALLAVLKEHPHELAVFDPYLANRLALAAAPLDEASRKRDQAFALLVEHRLSPERTAQVKAWLEESQA